MASVTVACVWTGDKYPQEYVTKLQRMVERHIDTPHRFVCYTDQNALHMNHVRVDRYNLPRWWAKMCLFSPLMRMYPDDRLIYLDLDTVVLSSLAALASVELPSGFGICANFARRAGATNWPCRYGSCVMVMDPWFGQDVWLDFLSDQHNLMRRADRHGDQRVIEWIVKEEPTILQDALPEGFFLNYRDFSEERDDRASLAIFGGRRDPSNCETEWIREQWQ